MAESANPMPFDQVLMPGRPGRIGGILRGSGLVFLLKFGWRGAAFQGQP
jgi:hypothetical protein